ncbi:metal ABC transporter permease [Candidatus Sneabacter namystus]|uniref:Metal ABC transporter permease n=1 Tax=Candidatus Sneabacter namystus TaxID=2601646 RepID=A0A5C0UIR0_9RICK|nr:metal ABC transporter permease [Candidatus Sneabacter namystus]QEK39640.1 metal ABC transporter permease [Candidatus Sneabacter namystus]
MTIDFVTCVKCCVLGCVLGCLGIVSFWKKATYLSDGLSHAGVLSVVIASLYCANKVLPASAVISVFVMWGIYLLKKVVNNMYVSTNIVSTVSVALALALSQIFEGKVDISNLVFGCTCGMTLIGKSNLYYGLSLAIASMCFVYVFFRQLVLMAFSKDLAKISGIRVGLLDIVFFTLLALVINFSIQSSGMLLTTALLLMPSATANIVCKGPYMSVIVSIAIAISSCFLGVIVSSYTCFSLTVSITLTSFVLLLTLYTFSYFKIFHQKI